MIDVVSETALVTYTQPLTFIARSFFFLLHLLEEAVARQGWYTRPFHFRSGPTSGPITSPGSQKSKSKISSEIFDMFNHISTITIISIQDTPATELNLI